MKNYINADVLIDVLSGNFEFGYTDEFLTQVLSEEKTGTFSLIELNDTTVSMFPSAANASIIWNGRTGYVSELELYYTFEPPIYPRAATGTILKMELENEIYLDVDNFSICFNNGAINFSGNLI